MRVLCRPAIAPGFRLAGLRPEVASDPPDGARRLASMLDDEDAGVILVQEDFHAALPEVQRRALARRSVPMVVPFPLPRWAPAATAPETFIAELLRRAVGYRVRLA
ncbi:MAG TPA: V-type ATP synthase subunit F [Gemmatimonadales bacterium]